MGASTVKWTTLDPFSVFNESDSQSHTKFEFCEENHKHLKNKLIYKAKQIMLTKEIPRKVYMF